jgi:two-component system sensor histidine kinase/response regulator
VQMPEMSGYEATTLIRKREAVGGGHIPIIALTAHAMKGDRERCFEAGMDAYVAKPIKAGDLFASIEELLGRPARRLAQDLSLPQDQTFDTQQAFSFVDNDIELLLEIAVLFRDSCPTLLVDMREAIAQHDGPRLARTAHTLKGSVGNFGAQAAFETASRLERMAYSGEFADAKTAGAKLEIEIEHLLAALASLSEQKVECLV